MNPTQVVTTLAHAGCSLNPALKLTKRLAGNLLNFLEEFPKHRVKVTAPQTQPFPNILNLWLAWNSTEALKFTCERLARQTC